MYSPVLELASFDELDLQMRKAILMGFLESLILANRLYIRKKHPPALYQMAPKYKFKVRPFGLDSWQDIPRTMQLGAGDCKDFAAWRVAELREAGEMDADPRVTASAANGIIVYHVQVMRDTAKGPIVEDPSLVLGMPPSMSEEQARSLIVGPAGGGVNGIYQAIQGGPIAPSPSRGTVPWYLLPMRGLK